MYARSLEIRQYSRATPTAVRANDEYLYVCRHAERASILPYIHAQR